MSTIFILYLVKNYENLVGLLFDHASYAFRLSSVNPLDKGTNQTAYVNNN